MTCTCNKDVQPSHAWCRSEALAIDLPRVDSKFASKLNFASNELRNLQRAAGSAPPRAVRRRHSSRQLITLQDDSEDGHTKLPGSSWKITNLQLRRSSAAELFPALHHLDTILCQDVAVRVARRRRGQIAVWASHSIEIRGYSSPSQLASCL